MTAEIYVTILQGSNRLVITGDMKLFQDLVSTIQGATQTPASTIYNPAPEPTQGVKHA